VCIVARLLTKRNCSNINKFRIKLILKAHNRLEYKMGGFWSALAECLSNLMLKTVTLSFLITFLTNINSARFRFSLWQSSKFYFKSFACESFQFRFQLRFTKWIRWNQWYFSDMKAADEKQLMNFFKLFWLHFFSW